MYLEFFLWWSCSPHLNVVSLHTELQTHTHIASAQNCYIEISVYHLAILAKEVLKIIQLCVFAKTFLRYRMIKTNFHIVTS